MGTERSQPGAELCVTGHRSVSALITKDSPAKIRHGMSSTVQTYHEETGQFCLLSLPLELRREIFCHYFTSSLAEYNTLLPIYHLVQDDKNCNIYCLRKCHTEILTVSRQVYFEARDILYRDTTWHISFNSLQARIDPGTASYASLRAFRSQPEFRFIQNISVGVMFHTVNKTSVWTSEDRIRLEINCKLLNFICETLLRAPNLRTLKLLWHDPIEHGDWEEKRDCLTALARLPETVECAVFLGKESATVHCPLRDICRQQSLSAQERAAKVDLNRHLKTVRQQHQACSQVSHRIDLRLPHQASSAKLLSRSPEAGKRSLRRLPSKEPIRGPESWLHRFRKDQ